MKGLTVDEFYFLAHHTVCAHLSCYPPLPLLIIIIIIVFIKYQSVPQTFTLLVPVCVSFAIFVPACLTPLYTEAMLFLMPFFRLRSKSGAATLMVFEVQEHSNILLSTHHTVSFSFTEFKGFHLAMMGWVGGTAMFT